MKNYQKQHDFFLSFFYGYNSTGYVRHIWVYFASFSFLRGFDVINSLLLSWNYVFVDVWNDILIKLLLRTSSSLVTPRKRSSIPAPSLALTRKCISLSNLLIVLGLLSVLELNYRWFTHLQDQFCSPPKKILLFSFCARYRDPTTAQHF